MDMEKILVSTLEHIQLSFAGVLIAVFVGVTIGVIISRIKSISGIVLSIADIIQTIPSLALLSILMIIFGIGDTTLIISLFLYSLLPIIRNTFVGILGVDKNLVEAGKGMGMTKLQLLFKVELPLALPIIFSGIRVALVTALGVATIGVLIGAGGLGGLIWRGVQMSNVSLILSGAVPVSLLAILFDYLLAFIEKKMLKARRA